MTILSHFGFIIFDMTHMCKSVKFGPSQITDPDVNTTLTKINIIGL